MESIVGKGENAGFQQFHLFPECFQKASFSGSLKVGIVWLRVNTVFSSDEMDNIIQICYCKLKLSAHTLLTLSQTTNFRLFQTQEFTDANFEFDESGMKFSKWVENTVRKGQIAHDEQFLLFPQCFQKVSTADT